MDVLGSPIITMILNVVAGALVSKGILDQNSRVVFIQVANNILASVVTVSIGLYSIYKMVDLHKHSITTKATVNSLTVTGPATDQTIKEVSTVPSEPLQPVQQTGLPISK